jgi:hypothetical protein
MRFLDTEPPNESTYSPPQVGRRQVEYQGQALSVETNDEIYHKYIFQSSLIIISRYLKIALYISYNQKHTSD